MSGTQIHTLAGVILGDVQYIENLAVFRPTAERIAQKHISYAIRPKHYPNLATALLGAIEDVLGEVAPPEILAA